MATLCVAPLRTSSVCYLSLTAQNVRHRRTVPPASKRGLGSASLQPGEQKRANGTTDFITTRGATHPDNLLAENVPANFFEGGLRPTLALKNPNGDVCYTECELWKGKDQKYKKNQVQVRSNKMKENFTVGFFDKASNGGQVACRFLSAKPH